MTDQDHLQELNKVFNSLTVLYRGYRGEWQPDGSIKMGDVYYPDRAAFISGINELAKARSKSWQDSLNRTEELIKQRYQP